MTGAETRPKRKEWQSNVNKLVHEREIQRKLIQNKFSQQPRGQFNNLSDFLKDFETSMTF